MMPIRPTTSAFSRLVLTAGLFWLGCGIWTPSHAFIGGSGDLFSGATASVAIKTIGFITDYRAYEPATPLGTAVGIDLGLEFTLVKIPPAFITTLESAGSSMSLTFFPVPRIIVHKGFGPRLDLGVSTFFYQGMVIAGGGAKLVVYHPDQGPTWAIRGSYTYAKISYITSHTFTPQILLSRKLDFADPYLGLGYQYSYGSVAVPVDLGGGISTTIAQTGQGGAFIAYLGVGFILGPSGLKITLEGAYNQYEAHSIGTKVSLTF